MRDFRLFTFYFVFIFFIIFMTLGVACAAPFELGAKEHWIKIDKNTLKIHLMLGSSDVPIKSYGIAIGSVAGDVKKDRTDLITPAGIFKVTRINQDATELVYDPKWFGEPGEPQKGAYGAKLISFNNPWHLAIHGTNSPRSIGRRVTHGCIRLKNKDITELVKYIAPGTKIFIGKLEPKKPTPQAVIKGEEIIKDNI